MSATAGQILTDDPELADGMAILGAILCAAIGAGGLADPNVLVLTIPTALNRLLDCSEDGVGTGQLTGYQPEEVARIRAAALTAVASLKIATEMAEGRR